jgi:hypothetical protein
MNEKEFIKKIEEETNKKLGTDFGFVMGTHLPYFNENEMLSSSMMTGWSVWKKENGLWAEEFVTTPLSPEESANFVIKFLNDEQVVWNK